MWGDYHTITWYYSAKSEHTRFSKQKYMKQILQIHDIHIGNISQVILISNFDYPFSLENNALGQIGFNSPEHTTHSNKHKHFRRKERIRATKSSITFTISFYILIKNPWKRAFLHIQQLYSTANPTYTPCTLRKLHSSEVNGCFVTYC